MTVAEETANPSGDLNTIRFMERIMSEANRTVSYRDVPNFPGYRVGDDGSVWSRHSQNGIGPLKETWRRLKTTRTKSGHLRLGLVRDRVQIQKYVHGLVLEAFVGPCPDGLQCCHFPDRNPANNRLDNLRWDTHKANREDMHKHGTTMRGESHPRAIVTEALVIALRAKFSAMKVERKKHGRTHLLSGARAALCAEFGITRPVMNHILNGECWKHL